MSPTARYLLISESAEEDYLDVLRESVRNWGRDSARSYKLALDQSMNRLLEFPNMGKPVPHLLEGGYCFRARHHMLYYTHDDRSVTIHRILHERRHVTFSLLMSDDD